MLTLDYLFTYGTDNENDNGHIIMSTNPGLTYSDDPLPIPLPPHHTSHNEPMETMIAELAELHAVADTTLIPR